MVSRNINKTMSESQEAVGIDLTYMYKKFTGEPLCCIKFFIFLPMHKNLAMM